MSVKAKTLTVVGKVSIFGWLENLSVWQALPYPVKGAVLRGLKAGLSVIVAALLTAATAGTLFPATWGPVILGMLVMALQGIDKYIREWNISENGDPIVEPDSTEPVDTDATVPADETEVDTDTAVDTDEVPTEDQV